MKIRMAAFFMVVLFVLPLGASAAGIASGVDVADVYETAMAQFYLEDYEGAASRFAAAGNYRDAKKWGYYCQAIYEILKNEATSSTLEKAQVRFELLAAQDFQQAQEWATYCKARAYENAGIINRAGEFYATILVHDSIERYLRCQNRSGALDSAETVRSRNKGINLPPKDLYESGMAYYYLENYTAAADYFCLAGNYGDARQWRCYCAAISLVKNQSLKDAAVLFNLLDAQGFEGAGQWVTYCKAREYEQMRNNSKAVELYKSIFVHDSSERYLNLLGR